MHRQTEPSTKAGPQWSRSKELATCCSIPRKVQALAHGAGHGLTFQANEFRGLQVVRACRGAIVGRTERLSQHGRKGDWHSSFRSSTRIRKLGGGQHVGQKSCWSITFGWGIRGNSRRGHRRWSKGLRRRRGVRAGGGSNRSTSRRLRASAGSNMHLARSNTSVLWGERRGGSRRSARGCHGRGGNRTSTAEPDRQAPGCGGETATAEAGSESRQDIGACEGPAVAGGKAWGADGTGWAVAGLWCGGR
eukprot:4406889-Amphidinium_carterae.2